MTENGATEQKVVVFRVGVEEYGVSIAAVKDVQPWVKPTPVPEAPPMVDGVINLRGEIIPVIDLAKLFRTKHQNAEADSRIMVIEMNDSQAGFVVDDVIEVQTFSAEAVAPPSPLLRGGAAGRAELVTGILKVGQGRLVILVDAQRILASLHEAQ
ncbi:MAG: chemotaxis protein CheW [Mycobacterium leprae]